MTKEELLNEAKHIPNSVFDRINGEIRRILLDKNYIIDVHNHIFTKKYVPTPFLRRRVFGEPDEEKTHTQLIKDFVLNGLDDFLINIFSRKMKTVFKRLQRVYKSENKDKIFGTLLMDMDYGWEGHKSLYRFEEQMKSVGRLVMQEKPILPFLALDPNNENLYENFIDAFTKYKFFGVKIYPALGYLPSHPKLMPIYEICEEKRIPVTTHCGGTTIRSNHSRIDARWTKKNPVTGKLEEFSHLIEKDPESMFIRKADANFLNDPQHWIPVLESFSNLKLNIGHFGGIQSFEQNDKRHQTIIELLKNKQYTVYTDISADIYDTRFLKILKNKLDSDSEILSKTMYGSDFYVVTPFVSANSIWKNFTSVFKDKDKAILATKNPHSFLFD